MQQNPQRIGRKFAQCEVPRIERAVNDEKYDGDQNLRQMAFPVSTLTAHPFATKTAAGVKAIAGRARQTTVRYSRVLICWISLDQKILSGQGRC